MPLAPAIDAASVLLLRDDLAGPQVYMVRRHSRSPFLPNAHVFVGGRLDAADLAPELLGLCRGRSSADVAALLELDPARAFGLHVAAIRECFEEAGVLLAERADGVALAAGPELERLRGRLAEGATLADLLAQSGLVLPVDRLRLVARWVTPEFEPRRFDTRFFVCRAPARQEPRWDPHETTAGEWICPDEALARHARHELTLAPPTLALLEWLRARPDVDAILAAAPDAAVPCILPRLLPGAPHITLLLPGDHRYDDPPSAAGPEHYVVLRDGRWEHVERLAAED